MGVKILSLFDGMACGMIAMQLAGVEVESYDAYEIDKYAIKTAQHNFPMIKEHGDVFNADFTQYEGVDFLTGGSPCTYWSIAQTKNRETVASGMGWELFSQYVRALHEAKPKYFIYENNKSMSKDIRASIDETFGFEAICINSALVSAQNRQRLYWIGKRNADGTYSKVNVEQPEDRGILLRDILENGVAWQEESYNLTTRCCGAIPEDTLKRHRHTMVAEPINVTSDGKAQCLRSTCYKDGIRNIVGNDVDRKTGVAEPVKVADVGNGGQGNRVYSVNGKAVAQTAQSGGMGPNTGLYAVPYDCDIVITENSIRCQRRDQKHSTVQGSHVNFTDGKTQTLSPSHIPNVIEHKSGKEITIYEVKDGKITIKGKQYPIKLKDGYYIIRKLTVSECKRLQTVPEWYEFCWVETSKQIFGEGVKICKNAKLKDAINLLQTEKLNYAINTTCGSLETEQRNLVENLSIIKTNAKPKGATDNSRHLKVTALCTTSVGNDNSRLTNQKSALFVTNQSGTTVATECVLGITLNGCYTETLYLTKNENMNLMEILGVNTTKHLTESGFIELLQKKCLEESSNQKKLFIISTLINWIIAKQTYMSATTKPTFISIDSLSDWQHHSLKMELSSLKMGNIGGVSNSAAYKMLGNGWTCEVICHLINSCFKPADVLPGQIGLWG